MRTLDHTHKHIIDRDNLAQGSLFLYPEATEEESVDHPLDTGHQVN